ncbi:MAG TPA: group I intron-associated PD-(D/E)XK endonuclease [Bacilli bacterium]|nr:group I intron-associated PD-(D/E)XK endonuclease [Bacilli bacterium]
MTYRHQGEIGVQKAIFELMKRDIRVYMPLVDDGVDILVEYNKKYYKIQCKTSKFTPKSKNCVVFDLTKTYHNNSKISVKKYLPTEVDYFFLYSDLYEDYPCLVTYNRVAGQRTFNIDFSNTKRHPLKNHYKEFNIDNHFSLRV